MYGSTTTEAVSIRLQHHRVHFLPHPTCVVYTPVDRCRCITAATAVRCWLECRMQRANRPGSRKTKLGNRVYHEQRFIECCHNTCRQTVHSRPYRVDKSDNQRRPSSRFRGRLFVGHPAAAHYSFFTSLQRESFRG